MTERRVSKIQGPHNEELIGEDLDYKTINEQWSEYILVDGTIIKLKVVLQKISRALTLDGKEIYYKEDGEPLYSVRFQNVVSANVPEKLLKRG